MKITKAVRKIYEVCRSSQGQPISLDEIAAYTETSRTYVRTVLSRLEAAGKISIVPPQRHAYSYIIKEELE